MAAKEEKRRRHRHREKRSKRTIRTSNPDASGDDAMKWQPVFPVVPVFRLILLGLCCVRARHLPLRCNIAVLSLSPCTPPGQTAQSPST